MRHAGFTVPQIAQRLANRHGLMRLSKFTVFNWVRGIPAPKGCGTRSLTPGQRDKVKRWNGSIASAAREYGVHRQTIKGLAMNWCQVDAYYIQAGDYRIAKIMHRDGWRYEPSYCGKFLAFAQWPESAAEAKRICEEHAKRLTAQADAV